MEVLFAKAFLSTPGSTRGFVKPKGSKKIPPGFIPGGIFAVVGAAKPAVAWAKSRANGLSLPFLFVGRRRAVCRADLLIDFRGKLWFPLIGIESVLLLLHIIELCVAERTDMGVIH